MRVADEHPQGSVLGPPRGERARAGADDRRRRHSSTAAVQNCQRPLLLPLTRCACTKRGASGATGGFAKACSRATGCDTAASATSCDGDGDHESDGDASRRRRDPAHKGSKANQATPVAATTATRSAATSRPATLAACEPNGPLTSTGRDSSASTATTPPTTPRAAARRDAQAVATRGRRTSPPRRRPRSLRPAKRRDRCRQRSAGSRPPRPQRRAATGASATCPKQRAAARARRASRARSSSRPASSGARRPRAARGPPRWSRRNRETAGRPSATSAIATIARAIPSRTRGMVSRVTVDATRKNAPRRAPLRRPAGTQRLASAAHCVETSAQTPRSDSSVPVTSAVRAVVVRARRRLRRVRVSTRRARRPLPRSSCRSFRSGRRARRTRRRRKSVSAAFEEPGSAWPARACLVHGLLA